MQPAKAAAPEADACPGGEKQSNRALAEHQQPLQAILHRLTVTPVVTNAHLPKLLETLHAAAAELQALMLVRALFSPV